MPHDWKIVKGSFHACPITTASWWLKAELDQLLGGLASTLNVLSLIRENASQMTSLFIYSKSSALTTDDLYDLLQPKLSPIGSNRREAEEAAVMQWCDFLQAIESTYTSQY